MTSRNPQGQGRDPDIFKAQNSRYSGSVVNLTRTENRTPVAQVECLHDLRRRVTLKG